MEVFYAGEEYPDRQTRSLFLAGLTPRLGEVPSWRPKALEMLEASGFDGQVCVNCTAGEPEPPANQLCRHVREGQFQWAGTGLLVQA